MRQYIVVRVNGRSKLLSSGQEAKENKMKGLWECGVGIPDQKTPYQAIFLRFQDLPGMTNSGPRL